MKLYSYLCGLKLQITWKRTRSASESSFTSSHNVTVSLSLQAGNKSNKFSCKPHSTCVDMAFLEKCFTMQSVNFGTIKEELHFVCFSPTTTRFKFCEVFRAQAIKGGEKFIQYGEQCMKKLIKEEQIIQNF